jgi:hypothetical protein
MMDDILDSSWIANILSISFSMVIFLLGIPILFIQTYVPEDLRKYYYQLGLKDAKFLKSYAILLLLAILFFGNHGFKVFLISEFADNKIYCLFGKIEFQLTKALLSIILYTLSLLFFTFISTKIYRRFVTSAFRRDNIKLEILNHFFLDLNSDSNSQKIPKEKWEDLIELSIIFDDTIERSYYLHYFYKYMTQVLKSSEYSGSQLKFYFANILYPMFVKKFDQIAHKEFDSMIDLCKSIIDHNEKNIQFSNYDFQYICDVFIFNIYLNFMKNEDILYAKKCVRFLRQSKASELTFFKVNYFAFEHKAYAITMEEIKNISFSIDIGETISNSRSFNLVAYLSFFYDHNLPSKQYVHECIKYLASSNFIIDKKILEAAMVYFYRMSKVDTAGKIANLKQNLATINQTILKWTPDNLIITGER